MIVGGDILLFRDGYEVIASTRGTFASLQEVPNGLTYEYHEQHVSMLIGNETKQRRDHSTDIAGDDPPPHGSDDGAISPIKNTFSSLRVIPNYHATSTQETNMNLCSVSRDMMIPYIMHMRMIHETSLSCGKPPRRDRKSVV